MLTCVNMCYYVLTTYGLEWQVNMGPRHHLSLCACNTAIRIICLYGSLPLSVVFACKTATFGAELQVSMGPRHDLSFCACKTAWLAPEILVSTGPSSHLWFLHAKQYLLDPNNKSLWVPDLTCPFVHAKHCDLRQKIKSIWVPALTFGFSMQNSAFMTRLTSLYGSQTLSVVLSTLTACLAQE